MVWNLVDEFTDDTATIKYRYIMDVMTAEPRISIGFFYFESSYFI